jgi:hypothetical protein
MIRLSNGMGSLLNAPHFIGGAIRKLLSGDSGIGEARR